MIAGGILPIKTGCYSSTVSWSVFPLHNGSDLRSVLPSTSQKHIYAGKLKYTCLSDSLAREDRFIGNIWGIHESDNILYLEGDGHTNVPFITGTEVFMQQNEVFCASSSGDLIALGNRS